jgi:hypothetical protein
MENSPCHSDFDEPFDSNFGSGAMRLYTARKSTHGSLSSRDCAKDYDSAPYKSAGPDPKVKKLNGGVIQNISSLADPAPRATGAINNRTD